MKSGRKRKMLLGYAAVIILLVFLYNFGVLKPLESTVLSVLNPITSRLYHFGAGLRESYENRETQDKLRNELEEVKREFASIIEENARLKGLEEENRIMRESLRFLNGNENDYILANVVSRINDSNSGARTEGVVIDRGRIHGIREGAAVVTGKGMLIGIIEKVEETTSYIILANNSRCKIAATILGDERLSGIVEGELGLTIRMKFIPQDRELKINDTVTTSGLEENIPRGLVIGRITEIDRENNELWQEAVVESLYDLDEFAIVTILLPRL